MLVPIAVREIENPKAYPGGRAVRLHIVKSDGDKGSRAIDRKLQKDNGSAQNLEPLSKHVRIKHQGAGIIEALTPGKFRAGPASAVRAPFTARQSHGL